ncbi:MAG TPA: hypothetical protein VK615_02470 [Candidatus Binatia bacterium]|nr:hypothetical protein [Candidatus Binatia bacterium]
MTPLIIVGSVVVVLFLWLVVATILWERKLARLPPIPPLECPRCKSQEIDVVYSGLWDGRDENGGHISGANEFGICKRCDSRCARIIHGVAAGDRTYIPTEEEWNGIVRPLEKMRQAQEDWPFVE